MVLFLLARGKGCSLIVLAVVGKNLTFGNYQFCRSNSKIG
jgi:hypothetical protein